MLIFLLVESIHRSERGSASVTDIGAGRSCKMRKGTSPLASAYSLTFLRVLPHLSCCRLVSTVLDYRLTFSLHSLFLG